ncbi:hypothetical protein OAV88_02750, partial [bacterium]|nr:hypothetical protein [bacterium]
MQRIETCIIQKITVRYSPFVITIVPVKTIHLSLSTHTYTHTVTVLHHGSDVWTDMANDFIEYIESKGTPGVQRLNWEE